MEENLETAVFGGGCFWCIEAVFERLKGVISVASGYAGGETESPSYEQVSSDKTGHAEVIRVEYNPGQISYNDLLTVFFASHDPTTKNRQGADVGEQYRSTILYTNNDQKEQAEKFIASLKKEGVAVVTELKPLKNFYKAEDYHQDYYKKNKLNPYCLAVINPKLKKLQTKFQELLKNNEK